MVESSAGCENALRVYWRTTSTYLPTICPWMHTLNWVTMPNWGVVWVCVPQAILVIKSWGALVRGILPTCSNWLIYCNQY